MENILRQATESDRKFIDVDLNKPRKRRKTSREIFQIELNEQEKQATIKGLPFARNIAREDFETQIKTQIDAQVKKYGSLEYPELLKMPVIEWDKYSNLKNFKVIKESERPDTNLSNKNPGLNVMVKTIRYQYKDYENFRFIMMESGPDAIKRAVINRAKLDKQVSEQIAKENSKKIN